MSGNYKPRYKTEKEEAHDIEKLNEATLKCADDLSEFFTEFVELDGDVADSENSIILDQVLNGVTIRMSILYHLLSSGDKIDD